MRPGRNDSSFPCHCVFRAIFRACYDKFEKCTERWPHVARISLERNRGKSGGCMNYSFRSEEFVADFVLISKRVLGDNTPAHRLFKYHYLLGADWKLGTAKLGINRGNFFHECYRVQQRLGRAFRETQPYGLFPIDEYFGGKVVTKCTTPPAACKLVSPDDLKAERESLPGRSHRFPLKPSLLNACDRLAS